jgi:hypothetical protein
MFRRRKNIIGLCANTISQINSNARNKLPDIDSRRDTLIIAIDCIRPVDAGSAVSLAKSIFDSGFQAASIKFVQGLCADSLTVLTDLEIPLQISTWLMEIGMHQEAETVLHCVLKVPRLHGAGRLCRGEAHRGPPPPHV